MTGGVTVERPLVVFGAQANFDSSEVNSAFVCFFHVFLFVIYKARTAARLVFDEFRY